MVVMAEWRGVELGEDDSTSEVDVELEETHPSDGAFFSSPHGEETNEDGAVDSLMRRASRTVPPVPAPICFISTNWSVDMAATSDATLETDPG